MVTILPKWTQPWMFCLKKREALKGIGGKQRYNGSILSHAVMQNLACVYPKTQLSLELYVLTHILGIQRQMKPDPELEDLRSF